MASFRQKQRAERQGREAEGCSAGSETCKVESYSFSLSTEKDMDTDSSHAAIAIDKEGSVFVVTVIPYRSLLNIRRID